MIDSGSEINAMTLAYAAKLDRTPRTTNVRAWKIDGSPLKTYGMTTIGFLVVDKLGKIRIFKETFLLADTSMEMVPEMLFLSLSYANIEFVRSGTLPWRSYDTTEILSTISRVQLIDKHKFAKVALDKSSETFVVHIVALEIPIAIHPS